MSELAFQFVAGAGLFSFLIERFGTQTDGFSHVDLLMPDTRCIGARSDNIFANGHWYPAGVQARPSGYEVWKRRSVVRILCTPMQEKRWIDWAHSQLGKPYDDWDILGYIFGHHWHTAGHWICSAMAGESVIACGRVQTFGRPVGSLDPNTMHAVANALATEL